MYLYAKQDYDKALEDYDRALELVPEDCAALRGRSQVFAAQGKESQAEADKTLFERVCATDE